MPCWIGIQVGVTDYDKAKHILQEQYGVGNVKDGVNSLEWTIDSIKGTVLFSKSKVVSEIFLVFDQRVNFLVKDLFDILGEPSWVDMSWGGPGQKEMPCFGVSLEFPTKGIWVDLNGSDEFKGVDKNQSISMIRFLPAPKTEKWQIYDFVTTEWVGYKDYCQSVIDSLP